MSLNPLWTQYLNRAVVNHFFSKDLGVPWEFEREVDGDKVSITFFDPEIEQTQKYEHLATFKVRLVCTTTTQGLYDLSIISGKAATLLLDHITDDYVCITPKLKKVKIEMFDFKYGHKQSSMEQIYTSRLKG